MGDPLEYPKLRWPLDIRLERLESQDVLLISCPLGITRDPLLLVPAVGPIIGSFEGRLSIQEITAKFSPYGLTENVVRELVSLLDKHLFLTSPRYFSAEKAVRDEFKHSPVRHPALAGGGYPALPEQLAQEIDRYLSVPNGLVQAPEKGMLGLVAPHIDYRRGSDCYGLTYRHLKSQKHDLYVLMGTAHQYSKRIFHLTRKNFFSPLGNLPTDTEFVDQLAAQHGIERSYADEFLHRREHSLELQLPFLHRLKKEPKLVPILVGGFHHMLGDGKFPEHFEEYDSFASALTECLKSRLSEGASICFIAGVDMAHVGQSFGDRNRLTPEFMDHVRLRDLEYLDTIRKHDRHKLFNHIAEDQDARKICGFPTMYTVLDVLGRLKLDYSAHVFDYRQAVDYSRDCAVTFAGIGLYSGNAASSKA